MKKQTEQIAEIEGILGKGSLTVYDAGRLIELTGKTLMGIPRAAILNAQEASDDLQEVVKSWTRLFETIKDLSKQIEKEETALYKRWETFYSEVMTKRRALEQKIKDLPPLPPVPIPYNIAELATLAERFSSLTDDQWARVVELARALSGKGGE